MVDNGAEGGSVSIIIEHSDYLYSSIFKYIYIKIGILSKVCYPIRQRRTIVGTLVLPKAVSTDPTYGYDRVKYCFFIVYSVKFEIRGEV